MCQAGAQLLCRAGPGLLSSQPLALPCDCGCLGGRRAKGEAAVPTLCPSPKALRSPAVETGAALTFPAFPEFLTSESLFPS